MQTEGREFTYGITKKIEKADFYDHSTWIATQRTVRWLKIPEKKELLMKKYVVFGAYCYEQYELIEYLRNGMER